MDALAARLEAHWLLWPLLAQVAWTLWLYLPLTVLRVRAVRLGQARLSTWEFSRDEPPEVARLTRNLANQFELPVIFYVCTALLAALDAVTAISVCAAWVFVCGRIIHTAVQALTGDVTLRGRVFMISFLACAVLVAELAWLTFQRSVT
jgi:hypothetical protein